MMPDRDPIITLLTDFGSHDYFTGAMKAVILSIAPAARIVDITHEIPPQDIHAAAFNLLACYRNFPPGSIHVAVVDPGVGSSRRAILIECAGQYFIGPDNGIFSWVCEREDRFRARELTNESFFLQPVSQTFHGRDVFAPVAAAIAEGADPEDLGSEIDDVVRLESIQPVRTADGVLEGAILHIDRFGNCITNFSASDLGSGGMRLLAGTSEITALREFYAAEGDASTDELFMITGSAGFIEIAARNNSAASILRLQRGQPVVLKSA